MASLQIKIDTDFAKDLLNDVQTLEFTNGSAGATAIFHHSQVDDIQIKFAAAVIGNANPNHLVFEGGEVNLKFFTFNAWDNSVDSITINGSNSTESLGGSSQDDVIDGKNGNDTLSGYAGNDILIGGAGKDKMYGGANNDEFWFTANLTVNDVVAGEIVNGGGGTDTLVVKGSNSQIHDFTSATLTSIEVLTYDTSGGDEVRVQLNGSQIGVPGGISQVNDIGTNVLLVFGPLVDLSSVVFGSATSRLVQIGVDGLGTVAVDASLTGSDQRDAFNPNSTGAVTVFGNDGDDVVSYLTGINGAGHSIDGGDGVDSIGMSANNVLLDLTQFASITNIEVLQFNGNDESTFLLDASHLAGLTTINSTPSTASHLTVNMGSGNVMDLSAIDFPLWTPGTDTISLNGATAVDTIIGSSQNDTISGKGSADTLNGGAGDDVIRGGGGFDTITGGLGRDVLTGNGGDDTFIFTDIAESPNAAGRDRITDFVQGEDEVDVSAIAAFTFIGGGAFDGSGNAELRFFQNAAGTFTTVFGDANGDGVTDFQIGFNGAFALTAADFGL